MEGIWEMDYLRKDGQGKGSINLYYEYEIMNLLRQ